MRRPVVHAAVSLTAFWLIGCEDGPNQTYSPAAGTLFNNGNAAGVADDGGAGLGASYSSHTKQQICSGDELQQAWSKMVVQPIIPPSHYAGMNLAGSDKYDGLRIETAEQGPINAMKPSGQAGPAGPVLVPNPDGPTRLCQSTNLGGGGNASDVGGSLVASWGNSSEVTLEWAVPTHKAYLLNLNPGYTGTMEWDYTTKSDGKKHHYVLQMGKQIQKCDAGGANCAPFVVHWNGFSGSDPKLVADVDELYRGIVSFFVPDIYQDSPFDCQVNGTCLINPTGNQDGTGRTVIGFRPAAFYFETYNPTLPQPSGSTIGGMYTFNVKLGPYSTSPLTLTAATLRGPFVDSIIGDKKKECVLELGGTYGDLLNNCINVFTSDPLNQLAQAKVLGNMLHDDQNYTFSVVGVNQNYRPAEIETGKPREFDIVHDGEMPNAQATADDFQIDVRTYGAILNDYWVDNTGAAPIYHRDRHGSGAVWKEYQRLVQTRLANDWVAAHGGVAKTLHDPSCMFPATLPTDFDPNSWRAPAGCTGFEGMISHAQAGGIGADPVFDVAPVAGPYDGGFKPGGPGVVFCNDALSGNYAFCGQSGDIVGLTSDLFSGSLQRVVQIMGNGNALNVPQEGRDIRFYFKQFMIAVAKYMTSPESLKGGTKATPAAPIDHNAIAAQPIDLDYLIFDSYGGGASRGEYVDLTFAGLPDPAHGKTAIDPTSIELRTLLVGSNWQATNFYRRLDREERALFSAMATDKTQAAWGYIRNAAGQPVMDGGFPRRNADMLLSNIFGAPALGGVGYSDASDKSGNPIPVCATAAGCTAYDPCHPSTPPAQVMKTAYYCATHVDPDCNPYAPTDNAGKLITRENGKALLDGYCGVFSPTEFVLNDANSVSGIKLVDTYPLMEEAKIELPNHDNPYDQSSPNHPIQVLVPWKPQQEGVGYPVSFSGTQDVFVETAQLDFTGQVVTPVIDFLPVPVTPKSGAPYTAARIMAVETEDFLGDVFLCYDTVSAANYAGLNPGRPGDILAAHMYSSAQTILDWIANHPGAQDACGIIVRYSPYNNYPDYIQATTNGVRLGIEQSAGFGRVSQVTIFSPGSGQIAPP